MRMSDLRLASLIGTFSLFAAATAHAGGYGVSAEYGYDYSVGFGVSYDAGCGGCAPPVAYAPPPVYAGGCGGCAPVAYAPPPPPPVHVGCGGCAPAYRVVKTNPYYTKQPIYLVNQGPSYSGPGIMIPTLTWSKGYKKEGYPYISVHPGYYDGGPYADPLGHRYIRRYGYHEQVPAGYTYAPPQPRIVTRYERRAPAPRLRTRHYAPKRRSGVVVRADAEVRHIGPDRIDVRLYRKTPSRRTYTYSK